MGSNSVLYMYKIMSRYIRSVFPSSAEKAREGATDITRNLFGEEPLDMPRGEITHFLQNESLSVCKHLSIRNDSCKQYILIKVVWDTCRY